MSRTSKLFRSGTALAVALVSLGLFAGTASAEVPRLTSSTPTVIGGQVIGGGHLSIGASTGYPQLRGEFFFGMSRTFDLAIMPGLTYGNGWLSGLNQGVGLNVDVPLRFTLATLPKAAIALRAVPYFRIGRGFPSWGVGGTLGVRASIPLPKLFSIVVGAETRAGFGSLHDNNCTSGPGYSCNSNFFEGATYAVIGLETFLKNKWFVYLEYDIGGAYASGGSYYYGGGGCIYGGPGVGFYGCGGAGHAMFNAHLGFGYMLH